MPQYRIEVSGNNRAKCKDTVCKKEDVKILKGELRFGTWVEIQDHGSWAWKHWGCVSGQQMERLHDACKKDDDDFDFDEVDGYDEITDADLQEKVRRCVKQAHIDAEDFKGDPEKNVPGAVGIRLSVAERRKKEKAEAAADSEDDAPPKKTKKRGRKAADDEDDAPPAKAKKAKKPAKVEDDDDDDDDAPITKSKKPKKATKATKVKDEEDDEPPAKSRKTATKAKAPAKKAARKSAAKEEEEESEEEKSKTKTRRGRTSKA